jgi:hypothetical protein
MALRKEKGCKAPPASHFYDFYDVQKKWFSVELRGECKKFFASLFFRLSRRKVTGSGKMANEIKLNEARPTQ